MIKLSPTLDMAKKKSAAPTTPDLKDFVPVTQAARQTGYSSNHVRLLAQRREIQAVKVGWSWLVSLESLKAYAQSDRARAH